MRYGRPVRRPPGLWRLAAAVVAVLLASGCDLPGFGAPDPKSTEGESVYSLWQGFFIASIFVALLVWGLIIYSVIRFRRRDEEMMPNQHAYNIPVEILYTSAPVLAVAVLFGFSVATEGKELRYGAIRMPLEQWGPWRLDEEDSLPAMREVERAVTSMLRPRVGSISTLITVGGAEPLALIRSLTVA